MKRTPIIASLIAVAVIAGAGFYAVNTIALSSAVPLPRVLFVGNSNDANWRRTLAGAQDAAQQFGVELCAQAPADGNALEQQQVLLRGINVENYAAVALTPANPLMQSELINEMASRTKLITVGTEFENSKRLCHVGYCCVNAGRKAARVVRDTMGQRSGKIVLLLPSSSNGDVSDVNKRAVGFREAWEDVAAQYPAMHCSIFEIANDANHSEQLAKSLAEPDVCMIVAFDTKAAESAIAVTAHLPATRRPPVLAFDPSALVYSAIEDGRVCAAIFDDPYRNGFEAIQRLAMYAHGDKFSLPMVGCGNVPLTGEVVQKDNLAIFRPHT
jgi:ABC-type sugar transport system substrate-binding protein